MNDVDILKYIKQVVQRAKAGETHFQDNWETEAS